MVHSPVAAGSDEWPESLWSLLGHTVVLLMSLRSLCSQTSVLPPWPHQEGSEGRMLALLPSLALARLWLECSHLPILEPPGTWTGGWSPPYLTLPAARLLCLVFGASQHPRRQRVPALWGDLAWCDPKPLPRFPRGRGGVWARWTPWQ